jgi:hypothetical protein
MASQNPHLFDTSDNGVEYTPKRRLVIGTTTSPTALTAADEIPQKRYYSTAMTSGTNYVDYVRLDVSVAGVEGIATRAKTLLTAASVGNAHGSHATLELDTSAGNVTGLGTGLRGNVVVADRAVAAGTYYGMLAEIYPLGNTAALPTGSNACLGINAQAGTAMDAIVNAISFSGTDSSSTMIYSKSATLTATGYIRVLVNGAKRYIPFCSATG